MFAVTRPPSLKLPTLNFLPKDLEKIIKYLFKNYYLSLGATTSSICLLKSQRFGSSVPFNAIEMVYNFLFNGFTVMKFD